VEVILIFSMDQPIGSVEKWKSGRIKNYGKMEKWKELKYLVFLLCVWLKG